MAETTSHLSVMGLATLLIIAAIVWWAVNHRRGMQVVLAGSLLLIGLGLFAYLSLGHRPRHIVVVQERSGFQRPARPTRLALGRVAQASQIGTTVPENVVAATEKNARPQWVGEGSRTLAGGDYVFEVSAGPHASDVLARRDLMDELRKSVDAYIDDLIEEPGAARRVQLSMDYILERLVQEQYNEPVENSFGVEMRRYYALGQIDKAARDLIRHRHDAAKVQARLGYAGGGFGLLLVLLATAFGYLKLDTLTKGYYSGRLKLAATAVILTAAAATALVVQQADPAASWPVGTPAQETTSPLDL